MAEVIQDVPGVGYYTIWNEGFETPGRYPEEGLDEYWDQGISTVFVGALDTDSAPPGGAPASWRDRCCRAYHPTDPNAASSALLSHDGLAPVRHGRVYLDFYLDALDGLIPGGASVSLWRVRHRGTGGGGSDLLLDLQIQKTALGVVQCNIMVAHNGFGPGYLLPSVAVQEFHRIEFYWNLDDQEWRVLLDGSLDNPFLEGDITGAAVDWMIERHQVGMTGGSWTQPMSWYLDNYKVQAYGPPAYMARPQVPDADIVDPLDFDDVTILTEHTPEIAQPGGQFGYFPITGIPGGPNGQSMTFIVPPGFEPAYLHAVAFLMTRVQEPIGPLVSHLYRASGVHGSTAKPTGPKLAVSGEVDDLGIAIGGVFDWVFFLFEESFLLTEGDFAVSVESLAQLGDYHVAVAALSEGGQVESHPGNAAQGSGGTKPLGWTVASGGTIDLFFRIYTRPAIIAAADVEGGVDQSPDPSSGSVDQDPMPGGPPPTQGGTFRRVRISEVSRLFGRATVTETTRVEDVVARELIVSRERMSGELMRLLEEEGLLLERYDLVEEDHPAAIDNAEEAFLLDRVVLEVTANGEDIIARELMAASEVVLSRIVAAIVREAGLITERAQVVEVSRDVTVAVRELLLGAESHSPLRAMGSSDGALLLERAVMVEGDRMVLVTVRELIEGTEVINTSVTPTVPRIVSATIGLGFPNNPDIGAVRCTFATGVVTESVRVEFQVNNGGWFQFQNMNVSPNTSGYISNWYQGVGGETLRFRVRPFAADGQTGTEGPLVTTSTLRIPGGAGGQQ